MSAPGSLFARALVAVLVLPGTVAFLVPLVVLAPAGAGFNAVAIAPVTAGVLILLWSVIEFYRVGKGTLAPWSPPAGLMVGGPYRYSRNPMYVGVIAILSGWALGFQSWILCAYAVVMAAVFHLRILSYEEPRLKAAHQRHWADYALRVPRWLF